MHLHDSRANNNRTTSNSSFRSNSNVNSSSNGGGSLLNKNRQDNDGKSTSAMSNLSSYSLIDDDHIDDQETINVGNLIIDLESDLEKEKIENEQQANAKTTKCSTTANAPTSTFGAKVNSSTVNTSTSIINSATTTTVGGKSNQKSSNKHSNISIASTAGNTTINISSTGGGGTSSNSSSINSNSAINSNSSSSSTSVNNNNNNNNNSTSSSSNSTSNICNNNTTAGRTVFKSDERGDLKMRITRETKPGKSEHKIVTSPNQKSPTSSCGNVCNSNSNSGHLNSCEEQDPNLKPSQSSSISSTKECGTSTSIGTITEPECLGPCEPGTSVTLEGIVWQETEGGILVVNVTWRGKTYVGALLDCTKHDWAPPRLCDSPASDIDSKAHKGVRTKRIVTRSNGIGLDEKNLLQTTGKLRNGKGRRILSPNELATCSKRQRESDKSNDNLAAPSDVGASIPSVSSVSNSETACVPMNVDATLATTKEPITMSNILTDKVRPSSPTLIGCNEPNCSKKFRNVNGLLYHQAHAHSADGEISSGPEGCSSSCKEKSKNNLEDLPENQKEALHEDTNNSSPNPTDTKQDEGRKIVLPIESKRTPSPQLSMKMSNKQLVPDLQFNQNMQINTGGSSSSMNYNIPPISDHRQASMRNPDIDKRANLNLNHGMSNSDHRKSPGYKHSSEFGHGSSNHSSSKMSSSSSKMSNPAPLPATAEEGMKPSGTSTGPPPAPHQQNCFFNPFFANTLSPYALNPYLSRSPLPSIYDQLPPTTAANAAIFSRFMNNIRVPVPPSLDSSSRLPFPPSSILPNPQMTNPAIPNMSSMTHPPLATGSPHSRMPSQNEPMLPPTSQQPPYLLPAGLNPVLGLPGSVNLMGPMGGPQVPSLVDDPLAKQFPRRFN